MIEISQPPTKNKPKLHPSKRLILSLGMTVSLLTSPSVSIQASPNSPEIPRGDDGPNIHLLTCACLPLEPPENYSGKYANAENAAKQINNRTPFLKPGDKFYILRDNIVTFNRTEGYVETLPWLCLWCMLVNKCTTSINIKCK